MSSWMSWLRDYLFKWSCSYTEAFKAAGNSWIEMVDIFVFHVCCEHHLISWTTISFISFFFLSPSFSPPLHLFFCQFPFSSCLVSSSAFRRAPDSLDGTFSNYPVSIHSSDIKNLCEIIYSFICPPYWVASHLLQRPAAPTDAQGICHFPSLTCQFLAIRLSR